MAKYSRTERFEAEQWNGGNQEALKEIFGKDVMFDYYTNSHSGTPLPTCKIRRETGISNVNIGDWIIKKDGKVYSRSDQYFHNVLLDCVGFAKEDEVEAQEVVYNPFRLK